MDLSVRRVSALTKSGVLPASKGRGGYDIDSCRVAYIRYLRGLSGGQVKGSTDDDSGEIANNDFSLLLEKEKFREKKRENDIAEKLVAPVAILTDALEKAGNQIIPILESLPLLMKRNWPEITGDQIQLVKKSIAECRNTIAEMEVELEG